MQTLVGDASVKLSLSDARCSPGVDAKCRVNATRGEDNTRPRMLRDTHAIDRECREIAGNWKAREMHDRGESAILTDFVVMNLIVREDTVVI